MAPRRKFKVEQIKKKELQYNGKKISYDIFKVNNRYKLTDESYDQIRSKLGINLDNKDINKYLKGNTKLYVKEGDETFLLDLKDNYVDFLKDYKIKTKKGKITKQSVPEKSLIKLAQGKPGEGIKKKGYKISNQPFYDNNSKIRVIVEILGKSSEEYDSAEDYSTFEEAYNDLEINADRYGNTIIRKMYTFIGDGDDDDEVKEKIEQRINLYFSGTKGKFGPIKFNGEPMYKWNIIDMYDQKMKEGDEYLNDTRKHYKLEEWSSIIKLDDEKSNCVISYIKQTIPQYLKDFQEIKTDKGIKFEEIENKMKEKNISYVFYDVNGDILSKYDKGLDAFVSAVIYNNHIYPIRNNKLIKRKMKNNSIIKKNNIDDELKAILDEKIIPPISTIKYKFDKINLDTNKVQLTIHEFSHDNIKYIKKSNHEHYYALLEKILESEISIVKNNNISESDFINILDKHFSMNVSTKSYIPNIRSYKRIPFMYKNTSLIKGKKIHTEDKNKCYSYCLQQLPFLIKHDYRYHKVHKYNNEEIIDHYLYLIKPNNYSLLFPDNGLYPGYTIKNLLDNITILEVLECDKIHNYFIDMIRQMYENIPEKEFKILVNKMIGKFECEPEEYSRYDIKTIIPKSKKNTQEGLYTEFGDHLIFFREITDIKNVMSRLPISLQIKDYSRMLLIQRIQKLNLSNEDIIQINTDSISYINKLPLKDDEYDTKSLSGWKKAEYKEIGEQQYNESILPSLLKIKNSIIKTRKVIKKETTNLNENKSVLTDNKSFKRKLYDQYAGSGKTTSIFELINIIKNEEQTYILLTPTHETLQECRIMAKDKNIEINCDIIHRYIYNSKTGEEAIPKEDIIIIDEIGLLDELGQNFLLKIYLARKTFICFGDFNQLSTDNNKYNSEHFINMMYDKINTTYINYRNNFSQQFYNLLISNQFDNVGHVNKYSTKAPEEAELILAYHNEVVDKYNKLMLTKLNQRFDKKEITPGIKLVCVNNKLSNKNIFNGRKLEVKKVKGNTYYLSDNVSLDKKEILGSFKPAYAMTVHKAQGKTLESYYWCKEDNNMLRDEEIGGRLAYTVISRLRQLNMNNIFKDIEKNKKIGEENFEILKMI